MNLNDYQQKLAEPFPADEISWKPEVTKKKDGSPIMRNGQQVAGCTAHIDARAVMNRLDDTVGPANWSDSYRVLNDGRNVECTLIVCGVSKADVGQVNKDGFADPLKSAYSDALKRAAVKFGIGRHLYDMEMDWKPFDGYRIIEQPKSGGNGKQPEQPPKNEPAQNGNGKKLMSAVAFRSYLEDNIDGFTGPEHVINTMKLLGFWPTPSTSDDRRRCHAAMTAYRIARAAGMSQDEALKEAESVTGND